MSRLLGVVVCAGALTGCASLHPSPCAGLVYSEAGLTRQQFGPCARAMTRRLDTIHEVLQVMGDPNQSKQKRLRARQDCMAATSDLARLIRDAGGSVKLARMQWDDTALNRFNLDVEMAKDVYAMHCYYGLTGPDVMQMDSGHASARYFAGGLR
jgi:hypothetical protein